MASIKGQKPHVPDEWVACWDESRQTWYYGNRLTKISQWEAPDGTFFPPDNNLPTYKQSIKEVAEEASSGEGAQVSFLEQDRPSPLETEQPRLHFDGPVDPPASPMEMPAVKEEKISALEVCIVIFGMLLTFAAFFVGLILTIPFD